MKKVVITTIQRLYSILSGEEGYDAENEEGFLFEVGGALPVEPKTVAYANARVLRP